MNAIVLVCPATRHSVLIDPGAEPDTLLEMLAGSKPVAIWVTHSHPDHIGALMTLRNRLNVPVMAHQGSGFSAISADRWLNHGDELSVGDHLAHVHYTPGHTQDQVCFALQRANKIVVGDTLFEGGPGKTWSAQDFRQTLHTLRQTVLAWPDETICYPGHGPKFCMGDKRNAIEQFLQKNHGAFFGDATWDM